MAVSTITGHLCEYVNTGEIGVTQLVEPEKVDPVLKVIKEVGTETLSAIKARLGAEYTFMDIKAVIHHNLYLQSQVTSL
jgi:hypothetical protein